MSAFTNISASEYVIENQFFFCIWDKDPVSPGHLLIISKRETIDFFDLNPTELDSLNQMIILGKELIEVDNQPDGYNIGMNCGGPAGQTIFHFHCHLIPRYIGDMTDPRGGVRHSVQGKGYYKN